VVIPEENEKDLVEIPKNIKSRLDIRPVRWIDEVLEIALTEMPEAAQPERNRGPRRNRKARARPGVVRFTITDFPTNSGTWTRAFGPALFCCGVRPQVVTDRATGHIISTRRGCFARSPGGLLTAF
jgi:hypothetical protein